MPSLCFAKLENFMIDKMILKKKHISEKELRQIQTKANLKTHTKNGVIYYDNKDTKGFNGGFFIQIDTKRTLKIAGSVHKFHNYLKCGKLDNYNNITMHEAQQSILKMLKHYGVRNFEGFNVEYYEVGTNEQTAQPTHEILSKLDNLKGKKFYFHPRFKNETLKTTETDKDKRRIFRVYDKLHELKDNRRQLPQNIKHLTRYETIYKRQNITLSEFLTNQNLQRLEDNFYKEIQELKSVPKVAYIGAGNPSQLKIELAKSIIQNGTQKTLDHCKKQFKNKEITQRQMQVRREFIRDWEVKELYKQYKVLS